MVGKDSCKRRWGWNYWPRLRGLRLCWRLEIPWPERKKPKETRIKKGIINRNDSQISSARGFLLYSEFWFYIKVFFLSFRLWNWMRGKVHEIMTHTTEILPSNRHCAKHRDIKKPHEIPKYLMWIISERGELFNTYLATALHQILIYRAIFSNN